MSTSITTAFITDYNVRAHEAFQRKGSYLLPTVRYEGGVVGSTHRFQVIGTGIATTKARHGLVTPMNQAHSTADATLADFYAGDYFDKLDRAKINIDERQLIANGGAMALGRKVDEQILAELDNTTQAVISWTEATQAGIRNSILNMVEALFSNDVANDGNNYGALTPRAWALALTVQEFSRADWIGTDGMPWKEGMPTNGRFKDFLGVKWMMHTGLPGKGTTTAKVFAWNKMAIGYAAAAEAGNIAGNGPVAAMISWENTRAAWFINHLMSGGSKLIEDAGVIEGEVDDTAALPTS